MFLSLEDISAVFLKWSNQYEIIKKWSTSAEKMIAAYQQQYHDCISKQPSMKKLPNKEWQVYHCLGCLRANFYFRGEKDEVCGLFLIRDKLRRRSFQGGIKTLPESKELYGPSLQRKKRNVYDSVMTFVES